MTLTATADTADVTNPFSGLFVLIHPPSRSTWPGSGPR